MTNTEIMKSLTSQKPRYAVQEIASELSSLSQQAIRLHPRPNSNTQANQSKIGGSFLWPSNQKWPTCPKERSYIPLLQIFKKDFPSFPFPEGKDLFQLLWLPYNEEPHYFPQSQTYYWNTNAQEMKEHPLTKSSDQNPNCLPRECQLHPETIQEYPSTTDLEEEHPEIAHKIQEWEQALAKKNSPKEAYKYLGLYDRELSTAEGCKLGGFVHWIQEIEVPPCDCGSPMKHLLTISTWEFDGGNQLRWTTQEEVPNPQEVFEEFQDQDLEKIQAPLNVMLGDAGAIYYFQCPKTFEVKAVFQTG